MKSVNHIFDWLLNDVNKQILMGRRYNLPNFVTSDGLAVVNVK